MQERVQICCSLGEMRLTRIAARQPPKGGENEQAAATDCWCFLLKVSKPELLNESNLLPWLCNAGLQVKGW